MRNNKKALYVGGFELPDKNAAAQRVLANGKLFSRIGYDVSYIGVSNDNKNERFQNDIINIDGFQFNSWKQNYPKSKKDWFYFITSINFVKTIIANELKNNIDIVVAYNYPALALWNLRKYCKKNKIKLIVDVTEWYQPEGGVVFKIVKGLDSYVRMNFLHKKVDGVIAISSFLFEYYKNSSRIQLPPLVDKKSGKWGEVIHSRGNIRRIVYVGSPGNGFKDRLDVVFLSLSRIKEEIGEFEFKIVGISKKEFLNGFGVNSFPNNLRSCVVFEGRKSHKEAIETIKASDYSIFLRDKNLVNTAGFPTKFVESISCNTPVLTNASSNIEDFLENGELGFLIDTETSDALDSSLKYALNQDVERINYMKQKCNLFNGFHFEFYENEFQQFLFNLNN